MSPDWREMRGLDGPAFLADTDEATIDRVDTYILSDEQPRVREAIHRAITAKDVFELEYRVRTAQSVGRSRALSPSSTKFGRYRNGSGRRRM